MHSGRNEQKWSIFLVKIGPNCQYFQTAKTIDLKKDFYKNEDLMICIFLFYNNSTEKDRYTVIQDQLWLFLRGLTGNLISRTINLGHNK
jgi:hypothetical protein